MNLQLEVLRLTNDDVIATSSQIVVRGNLEACYYITNKEATWYYNGIKSIDGQNTQSCSGLMARSLIQALNNVYGEGNQIDCNTWYAMYSDGNESYLYKHADTSLSGHTHDVSD